jgi:DNA-binding NarL/FixJ family response regulator
VTRQQQILLVIAEGMNTKGITCKLKIATKPVETHCSNSYRSFQIHDIARLVRTPARRVNYCVNVL